MKVAVVGASGQLGADVSREFRRNGDEVCDLCHSDIEICSLQSVQTVLGEAKPRIIVNTAAMHNVERCENDPLKAYQVNSLGSRNLALVARQIGAVLVHVSTDYVFDGSKKAPYVEADLALPLNVYGNTKLAGESLIRATADKYFILRTSALYGANPCRAKCGRNFVELMLKLAGEREELRVVDDEVVSPTSTSEVARQIAMLCQTDNFGLYHATSEGSCTWYEFAARIFDLAGVKTNLRVAAPGEFPAKVARPSYSVLENHALKVLGLNSFQTWEEGLRSYFLSRKNCPLV
ncbi:MAG TPA: dTDP-4-dehydrorhamnose reductase [Candidatus Acidoferrum sp.]|jgi:dTDP-4-dehydrorhamnose reductase|nr:dTDP-4-dehydrorhamnose reductase [Candidatus Acidoferrum sp.]